MPLNPTAQAMRDNRMRADAPQLYTLSVAEARAADLASIQEAAGAPEAVHDVEDRTIPGPEVPLPIRVYRPSGDGPYPVLVYYFGGGWTLGNLDTSDAICRSLTNLAGCAVIAVGYRLAPEAKFPAAVEDSYAGLRWIVDHAAELDVDPARVAVGGDSAGGNLATAVTLLARERGGPALVGQMLVYPNTDYRAEGGSMAENIDPYLFNRTSVGWYWANYLADPADGDHPLASPLRAPTLSGLPPALVLTAEYDPLRDQGEQYARRLLESGVPTEHTRYEGVFHGFFAMTGTLAEASAAQRQAADCLRRWFA